MTVTGPPRGSTGDTRDEVAAQRFRRRRLRSALLTGDPDTPANPMGRLTAGVYGGVLVTVLLLTVAGIYGVVRPGGSTAWQEPGALVVDEDAGGRYVYLDGVLHPILNYASARLLLGDALHVVTVSSSSLTPAPRGPMIGIPMAPDALPDAGHVTGTDWSVCAVGRAVDGQVLRAEIRPGVAAAGTVVGDDTGYLVRTEAGRTWLIWSGQAHEIPDEWLPALGYQNDEPTLVADAFVSALPAGDPLTPPQIAGLGEPGPALPGSVQPTIVGTVYADRSNAYYVMTRGGLATLTPLQAQLLLADPALDAAYPGSNPTPLKVNQSQVTEAAPKPLPGSGAAAAPTAAPEVAQFPPGEQQLCARWVGGGDPELVAGPAEPTPGPSGALVRLAPGTGALIAPRPAAENADSIGTTVFLVTDTGTRYPLADQRTLELIGLADAPIAQLPDELLSALPIGPTLDPAVAAAPAS